MKICFIADGNSIHARRWIAYFCKPENEIHILSTTYCLNPVEGASVYNLSTLERVEIPVDAIGSRESPNLLEEQPRSFLDKMSRLVPRRVTESELFGMAYLYYRVFRFANKAKAVIQELQPDIVHCLRLPLEGCIGGLVGYRPLAISTWGEDFVYFGQRHQICRRLTKKAMLQVGLFFPDSLRDKYIAEAFSFSPSNLTAIMPVIGGLKLEELSEYHKDAGLIRGARLKLGISPDANVLISVRGFKNVYVHTKTLVESIPEVVQSFPNTIFVLKGDTQSSGYFELRRLAECFGADKYIRFTDRLSVQELTDYFTASDIMVSVTLYDGCPVSMLEGMAYGLIPVMSCHSPIQEWIINSENGYLFNPRDPKSIAQAIIRAFKNKNNFEIMRQRNWELLAARADYYQNMKLAEELYHQAVNRSS